MKPLVSLIIPTLNSEKTLRICLDSIKEQSYGKENIEILVIDGGSNDNTRKIALEYGSKIVENPRIQPECAKHEGLLYANGKYGIFIDSDEAFYNRNAISDRVNLINGFKDCYIVLSDGYIKPKGYSSINDYINVFSDPFSFFIYKQFSIYGEYYKNWHIFENIWKGNEGYIYKINLEKQRLPLVDLCAGNMVNIEYIRGNFKEELQNVNIIPNLFAFIIQKSGITGIMKDSPIIHYSPDTFSRYIKKLRWRVIVNIFYVDKVGVGFSNRSLQQKAKFTIKKYLFIPYSLTLFLPSIEGIYYSIRFKKIILLLHPIFTFYDGYLIFTQYIKKLFGFNTILKAYGEK